MEVGTDRLSRDAHPGLGRASAATRFGLWGLAEQTAARQFLLVARVLRRTRAGSPRRSAAYAISAAPQRWPYWRASLLRRQARGDWYLYPPGADESLAVTEPGKWLFPMGPKLVSVWLGLSTLMSG